MRKITKAIYSLSRFAIFTVAALPLAASAQTVDELRQFVQSEQHSKAFALAKGMEARHGEVEFDLYFGIAAVASGNPAEGVLALERVVLQDPDQRVARHYLARGYFGLGDDARARQEFESLSSDADADERKAIGVYLDAINEREASYRTQFAASIELAMGRDSNINSGLALGSSVYVPGFGTLPSPDRNSVSIEEADSITQIAAGASVAHPLAPGTSVVLGLAGSERRHGKAANEQFDMRNAGLSLGLSILSDKSLYRLALGSSNTTLGGASYGTSNGVSGEWSYKADALHQFTCGLSVTTLEFEDIDMNTTKDRSTPLTRINASARDSRQTGLSMRWATALRNAWQTTVGNTLSVVSDKNLKGDESLSRILFGWKLDIAARPMASLSTGFAIGYQAAMHRTEFSVGDQKRQDFLSMFDAFADFAINRSLSVRAEYAVQEQDSNIGLFDYGRNQAMVKVIYQYK